MGKKTRRAALGVVAVAALFLLLPANGAGSQTTVGTARASLIDTNGNPAGTVRLTFLAYGQAIVDVRVAIPPEFAGFHGFHVHSVGVCDKDATGPDGAKAPFVSAGGHLNTTGHTHGHHDGDMPPLLVNRDGTATATFRTDHINRTILFDGDGSAIIFHAQPDNLGHIPTRYAANGPDAATLATGDAGARVACGVLKR